MLWAELRGYTTLAKRMDATEFSRVMNCYYITSINVLVHADAFIDKLVGDEVIALFIPAFADKYHPHQAVEAGRDLKLITRLVDPGSPRIQVGVGVHTGLAWVDLIAEASVTAADFTASGDNVNIAARLAYKAGTGEVFIGETTWDASKFGLK